MLGYMHVVSMLRYICVVFMSVFLNSTKICSPFSAVIHRQNIRH